MATPYPFLDILANAQVRDAHLAGRITLILSPDLETILWANGTGARFLGFHTVAESLQAVGGFSILVRRSIENAIRSGVAVSVPGVEGVRDFFANRLFIAPLGEIVFLRSSAAERRNGFLDLTEGLSDETSEAALLDISGRLMFADKGFNEDILNEAALPQLLAEANRDGEVKKRFLGAEHPYPVGLLRLNQKPPVFLLITAKNKKKSFKGAHGAFVFNPQLLPTRFVWQSDANGTMTEVSPELEQIVGPLYAAVAGRKFVDFAKAWQMDKDGAVRTLLRSGNPWSDQVLNWPVEGGKYRVKVVLSGLPIYSADKQFKGFRGFGFIEKVVDIMSDEIPGYNDNGRRNLSDQEQEAFQAIAEKLRQGLLPKKNTVVETEDHDAESVPENMPIQSELNSPALIKPGERDIFAELAHSVRTATERGIKKGERSMENLNQEVWEAERPTENLNQEAEEAERPTENVKQEVWEAERPTKNAKQEVWEAERPTKNVDQEAQRDADFERTRTFQHAEATPLNFVAQSEQIKRLETELSSLHYQKDKLNFLLNATTEAVLVLDKRGNVLSANAAAARLFGYDLDSLTGKAATLLFVPATVEALHQDIITAEAEKAGSFLKAARGAEGRTRTGAVMRLRFNFGCLEQGESYFLLIRDMTRFHDIVASLLRKNSEEAELYQKQSRYLALVSHEIRAPMNAVLGMAQFVAEERAGPLNNDKYKEYLQDIVNAGGHIMTLINDLLQISQKKADWLKMDRKPLLLPNILNEVLALMTPQANAANIIIRSGVADDLPPVLADIRAVKQIFLNLIGNAIHFTPQGGQIIISAHELKDQGEFSSDGYAAGEATEKGSHNIAARRILVRISDTGIGMSEAEIAYSLRDPLVNVEEAETLTNTENAELQPEASQAEEKHASFFAAALDTEQGNDDGAGALKSRMKGAGLGLPMVRTLAAANNIRFSLNSEPGKGTIAALVFPVSEQIKL